VDRILVTTLGMLLLSSGLLILLVSISSSYSWDQLLLGTINCIAGVVVTLIAIVRGWPHRL